MSKLFPTPPFLPVPTSIPGIRVLLAPGQAHHTYPLSSSGETSVSSSIHLFRPETLPSVSPVGLDTRVEWSDVSRPPPLDEYERLRPVSYTDDTGVPVLIRPYGPVYQVKPLFWGLSWSHPLSL